MPLGTFVILGVENVRAGNFAFGPIAGDNVVTAVAIKVAHADFVAFLQIAENNFSLPRAFILRVYDYFVAMPRLDGRQNALPFHPPDRDIAGSFARRVFLVTFRQ